MMSYTLNQLIRDLFLLVRFEKLNLKKEIEMKKENIRESVVLKLFEKAAEKLKKGVFLDCQITAAKEDVINEFDTKEWDIDLSYAMEISIASHIAYRQ